jgi:hypothetical protein
MKVESFSALRIAAFTPRKYSWYSFLLEAKSTPRPQCCRKDYVNEKFQWHHRESIPRPSGLYRSAILGYVVWKIVHNNAQKAVTIQSPILKKYFFSYSYVSNMFWNLRTSVGPAFLCNNFPCWCAHRISYVCFSPDFTFPLPPLCRGAHVLP